jgi:adenylate kinase
MKIILLGSPGAGKGTVSKLLIKHDGSVHISTGDILRAEVKNESDLGLKAKSYMESGALVPDSLIIDMMERRLNESDCKKGFILDGFPRTLKQAEELDNLLVKLGIDIDFIFNINIGEQVVLDRLTTRRTCSNSECQAIYNVKSMPPVVEGVCDKCGNPLVQRSDETGEAILKRLDTYKKQSAPLIGYYQNKGVLVSSNSTSSEEIYKEITAKLK